MQQVWALRAHALHPTPPEIPTQTDAWLEGHPNPPDASRDEDPRWERLRKSSLQGPPLAALTYRHASPARLGSHKWRNFPTAHAMEFPRCP